jgi:hypothetical protein
MSVEEIEAEALRLGRRARARLAGKLRESLEDLSEEENGQLWAEEAERRGVDLDAGADSELPAEEVFRDVRNQLK